MQDTAQSEDRGGRRTLDEPPSRSLADFTRQVWPLVSDEPFIDGGWYLQQLCRYFEAVLDGRAPRLSISAPPKAMKTTIAQLIFPAWAWLMRPDASFLMVSPSSRLAEAYRRERERLAASPEFIGYQRWCGIVDQPAGRRDFTAAVGAVPSHRYDVIIGDDILVHPRFAMQTWAWWNEHLSMRLRPRQGGGGAVLIQSRSSFDDMACWSINSGGYTDLRFPMEWHPSFRRQCPDDPRRAAGELLCPGIWNRADLDRAKATIEPDMAKWLFQQGLEPPKPGVQIPIIPPFLVATPEPRADVVVASAPAPAPAPEFRVLPPEIRRLSKMVDNATGAFEIESVAVDGEPERGIHLTHTDKAGKIHPMVLAADDADQLGDGLKQAARHSRGWRYCDSCDAHTSPEELASPGIEGNEPTDLWCRECRDVEVCALCAKEAPAETCQMRGDLGWICKACADEEAREIAACHHTWNSEIWDDEDGEPFRMCKGCGVCMLLEVGDDAFPFVCDGWVAVPEG